MSEESVPNPVHFDKIGQIAVTVNDLARAKEFLPEHTGHEAVVRRRQYVVLSVRRDSPDDRHGRGAEARAVAPSSISKLRISRAYTRDSYNAASSLCRHRTWWRGCPITIYGSRSSKTRRQYAGHDERSYAWVSSA